MYRKVRLAYIISDREYLDNNPIYVAVDNMGSFILQMNDVIEAGIENINTSMTKNDKLIDNKV